MKNLILIIAVLFCSNLNAQFVLSYEEVQGGIQVINETTGNEISFPILNTKWNRENPPNYKFYYFGEKGQTQWADGSIKKESVSRSFEGLNEFLKKEGYRSIAEVTRQGLAVYFLETKSDVKR